MNYKNLLIVLFCFSILGCENQNYNNSKKITKKIEPKYSNIGFALIYNEDLEKIKKIDERSLFIFHKSLKRRSSVKITKLEDGVFFSILDIQSNSFGHKEIDSRPSDALAVALRMHSPILVADDVMDEALILESDTETIDGEINQEPEVQLLERQLQKAIDKEEYEMAARIRDKIKEIDT